MISVKIRKDWCALDTNPRLKLLIRAGYFVEGLPTPVLKVAKEYFLTFKCGATFTTKTLKAMQKLITANYKLFKSKETKNDVY